MHADSRKHAGHRGEQPTGDLALLLDAEARFAEQLEEAKADRARIVAAARQEAAASEQSFVDSEAAELSRVEARMQAELFARIEKARQEATARMGLWTSLTPAQIEILADQVVGLLLGKQPVSDAVRTGTTPEHAP